MDMRGVVCGVEWSVSVCLFWSLNTYVQVTAWIAVHQSKQIGTYGAEPFFLLPLLMLCSLCGFSFAVRAARALRDR